MRCHYSFPCSRIASSGRSKCKHKPVTHLGITRGVLGSLRRLFPFKSRNARGLRTEICSDLSRFVALLDWTYLFRLTITYSKMDDLFSAGMMIIWQKLFHFMGWD